MSYSLPNVKYNINKNKNDNLNILINNIEYNIIIPYGFYSITELLNYINNYLSILLKKIKDSNKNELENIKSNINENELEIIKSNKNENELEIEIEDSNTNQNELEIKENELDEYIIFTLDEISQKIKINSNIDFKFKDSYLLKKNLGFTNINNKYIADNIYDLRLDNKIYLFLRNISDTIPFGILYFNNISICNFNFETPINLDKLDIIFIDEYGNNYNFYNLPHELNFIIEKNI
jgi:hypothetical protein